MALVLEILFQYGLSVGIMPHMLLGSAAGPCPGSCALQQNFLFEALNATQDLRLKPNDSTISQCSNYNATELPTYR